MRILQLIPVRTRGSGYLARLLGIEAFVVQLESANKILIKLKWIPRKECF